MTTASISSTRKPKALFGPFLRSIGKGGADEGGRSAVTAPTARPVIATPFAPAVEE